MVRSNKKTRQANAFTVDQLVAKAEEMLDQFQPDLALQFYERALQQQPTNTKILDTVGTILADLGDFDRAQQALLKSVQIAPSDNPSKYFYLSQLSQAEEAEKYSLQGIGHLQQELHSLEGTSQDAMVLKKQICDAYCGLSELYMTDLCDLDEAESKCEEYLTEAMKFDVGLPEPTQAFANLRLTQQRPQDAIPLLQETVRRMKENCDETSMPSLEFRVLTGKHLIEADCHEEACDVLETILQEDEDNAELWFLVGTCYRAMDELETALECFEKCEGMLSKLQKEMQKEFYLDEQLESVRDAITELKQTVANLPEDAGSDDSHLEEEKEEDEDVDMEG